MADRISLAGWSLHRRFQDKVNPLRLLDFARVAREEFGFDAIELNNVFFESTSPDYLSELRRRAESEGVDMLNIAVDGCGDMSSAQEWRDAVQQHLPWLDAAAALGCTAIRANTGGKDALSTAEALEVAKESFAALASEGAARGVAVVIENHWGLSTDPVAIV
ncbi:MAG TPA: TIM barrel protein, partial [Ardenticatenaceae bacterium]|nr:TIM barrel protein [Ardenticatenaceae bacterium]